MPQRKWFKPKKERKWKKTQNPETRRKKLLKSTDQRKSLHNRRLEASRAAQALANVTEDEETERKASADARYFRKRL